MAAKLAWPEVSVMETLATRVLIVHLTWVQSPPFSPCSRSLLQYAAYFQGVVPSCIWIWTFSSWRFFQTSKAFLSLLAIHHPSRMDSFPLCPSTEHNFHRLLQFPESYEHPRLQWSAPMPQQMDPLRLRVLFTPKNLKQCTAWRHHSQS